MEMRIGELARRTGIGVSTLRAWESRFQFLEPTRTAAGHRLYDVADVERVEAVVRLLGEGLTLPAAIARVAMVGPGALPEGEAEALLYGQILQAVQRGVWVSRDGRTRYANRRMAEIMGHTVEELLAIPVLEFFAPEQLPLVRERTAEVRAGKRIHFRQELRRADGSTFLAEIDTTPLVNQAGRYEGAVSMVDDVTARHQAEVLACAQATALDNVDEAVTAADANGRMIYINRGAERLFGWRSAAVLGRDGREVMAASSQEADRVHADLLEGRRYTGPFKMRRHDDSEFLAALTSRPAFDDDGMVVALVGVTRDQTERDEAQSGLRVRELQAETLAVLGSRVLRARGGPAAETLILTEALEATRRVLRADQAVAIDCVPGGEDLGVRAASPSFDVPITGPFGGSRSMAGYVALAGHAVLVDNMDLDRRFDRVPGYSTASAVGAPIFGPTGIDGVLVAGSSTLSMFDTSAMHFIQGMANIIATSRLS
jgi:PAS domain S-box-containing protein